MPRFNFKGSVSRATRQRVRQDIIDSLESSPKIRKEISRVFQMANRRIQNIERAGIFSPAVADLHIPAGTGYTKFGMRGSWDELKSRYAKAVSFLQMPTSTASGARQYNQSLQAKYGLDDDKYAMVASAFQARMREMDDRGIGEKIMARYHSITDDLEQSIQDSDSEMLDDAARISAAMDENVDESTDKASVEAEDTFDDPLDHMRELLDEWGL